MYTSIHEGLPPVGKIVEIECNGAIHKASLYEISNGLVIWLIRNEDKIIFSTAENWRNL